MQVMIVSDTPWGYGSPQVNYLRDIMSSNLGLETSVFAPVYPNREIIKESGVINLITEHSIWSRKGLIERLNLHLQNIHTLKPEILILVNPENLMLLARLKYKPKLIVYYGLEHIGSTFITPAILNKNQIAKIDVMISPEVNRAKSDGYKLRISRDKIFVVMNCSSISNLKTKNLEVKINRFIYAGSLNPKSVDLDTLNLISVTSPTLIYGDENELKGTKLSGAFMGIAKPSELEEAYSSSSYSLVLWKTNTYSGMYAAPNKLFQSIMLRTPFVSYPYPQAKGIVEKYGCGILASDFTSQNFQIACEKALHSIKNGKLEYMRLAAEMAAKSELNWEHQISPVLNHIEKLLRQ